MEPGRASGNSTEDDQLLADLLDLGGDSVFKDLVRETFRDESPEQAMDIGAEYVNTQQDEKAGTRPLLKVQPVPNSAALSMTDVNDLVALTSGQGAQPDYWLPVVSLANSTQQQDDLPVHYAPTSEEYRLQLIGTSLAEPPQPLEIPGGAAVSQPFEVEVEPVSPPSESDVSVASIAEDRKDQRDWRDEQHLEEAVSYMKKALKHYDAIMQANKSNGKLQVYQVVVFMLLSQTNSRIRLPIKGVLEFSNPECRITGRLGDHFTVRNTEVMGRVWQLVKENRRANYDTFARAMRVCRERRGGKYFTYLDCGKGKKKRIYKLGEEGMTELKKMASYLARICD